MTDSDFHTSWLVMMLRDPSHDAGLLCLVTINVVFMIILVTEIVFSSPFCANRLTTQWYLQLKLKHATIFQNFG